MGATRNIESLPDSVEALLTVQIDRLPLSDRTVLRYASVLGASFERGLLDAIVALERGIDDGVWTRLSDFLSVDSTGTFRFRHALIRDVAYEGLPFRRRREIHARAGETIELWGGDRAREQAEVLSLHFYQAGRYQEAWEYSCLAADRAQAKYANGEAADFYRRALDAARRLGGLPAADTSQVMESLVDVAERGGTLTRSPGIASDYERSTVPATTLQPRRSGRTSSRGSLRPDASRAASWRQSTCASAQSRMPSPLGNWKHWRTPTGCSTGSSRILGVRSAFGTGCSPCPRTRSWGIWPGSPKS